MLSQAKPVRRWTKAGGGAPAIDRPRVIGEMSYEKFLRLGDDAHAEWVEGEVIEMAPVTDEHDALRMFLIKVLGTFVDARELGELRSEPFQMKTGADLPGRSPDLLFVAKRNIGRLKRLYLEGPADVAVEIISPGSVSVDRGPKYAEYEQGGVREYWLLDPQRKQADFYRRGRDGLYQRVAVGADGTFRSAVIRGFWIDPGWLWQRPLPSSMRVLKALGVA